MTLANLRPMIGADERLETAGTVGQSETSQSGTVVPIRPEAMSKQRQFKFDRGDWIAVRNYRGEWVLGGKVVDADSESITVEWRGIRSHYVPGDDIVAHIRWTDNGRWSLR